MLPVLSKDLKFQKNVSSCFLFQAFVFMTCQPFAMIIRNLTAQLISGCKSIVVNFVSSIKPYISNNSVNSLSAGEESS